MIKKMLTALCIGLCLPSVAALADDPIHPPAPLQQQEALEKLAAENSRLQAAIELLGRTSITRDDLLRRNLGRLQTIAKEVKPQRQAMADFEVYIKWMSGSLSSYSRYVEAGSAAAALARFLPIPYAGQAGAFAKFVAHFALSLNAASNAVEKYLKTSQQFVTRVEAVDGARPLNSKEIAELDRIADEQLLKDMIDVQGKLTTTSELSSSALAFLEGMNQYLASTDEYWNKTKQLITRKEADPKERSFLSESVSGLKARAASFNARLRLFADSTLSATPMVKTLGAYDELIRELDGKTVAKNP